MIDWKEIVLRLVLACALGGIIGFERERRARAAGLRTHMLVSLGAALAIIVSAFGFADVLGRPAVVLDPSRIAAQVVSGVGFLGAGAILFMHRTEVVRGLTTAAGLWTVAAIGLAAGSGLYAAALAATVIAWLILVALKSIETRFLGHGSECIMHINARSGALALASVETALRERGLRAAQMTLNGGGGDQDSLDLAFDRGFAQARLAALADQLRSFDGVFLVRLDSPRD
jgi:putative Mg2+ transporter-C (MgtC) family protein